MSGSPFTLYRRKESGTFYARFRLPDGTWSNPKSTRQHKKRAAEEWCKDFLAKNGSPVHRWSITVREFAAGFFDPGGLWDRKVSAHRGAVRGAHLRNQQSRLENYLLPTFGDWRLPEIVPADIDRALLYIRDTAQPKRTTETGQLSNRTVNSLHAALNAILSEAARQGLIARNPMTDVPRLSDRPKARGILTAAELHRLLDPEKALEVWRHPRYWLIFRIAATTAARSGEIRTLHRQDVLPDHLILRRSWDDIDGLTPNTKTGQTRTVPLHESLHRDLIRWAETAGISSGFLFESPVKPGDPIDRDSVLKNFRASLERAGIDRDTQARRNVAFHSLRHAATTLAVVDGVNPWLVRRMTGHKSAKVFEQYLNHAEAADWSELDDWQGRLLDVDRHRGAVV
jgi:integrase